MNSYLWRQLFYSFYASVFRDKKLTETVTLNPQQFPVLQTELIQDHRALIVLSWLIHINDSRDNDFESKTYPFLKSLFEDFYLDTNDLDEALEQILSRNYIIIKYDSSNNFCYRINKSFLLAKGILSTKWNLEHLALYKFCAN